MKKHGSSLSTQRGTASVIHNEQALPHNHQRGEIKDNAMKALVTSPLFKTKVEKAKKGKGSFRRSAKHKGQEPYFLAA